MNNLEKYEDLLEKTLLAEMESQFQIIRPNIHTDNYEITTQEVRKQLINQQKSFDSEEIKMMSELLALGNQLSEFSETELIALLCTLEKGDIEIRKDLLNITSDNLINLKLGVVFDHNFNLLRKTMPSTERVSKLTEVMRGLSSDLQSTPHSQSSIIKPTIPNQSKPLLISDSDTKGLLSEANDNRQSFKKLLVSQSKPLPASSSSASKADLDELDISLVKPLPMNPSGGFMI